MANGKPFITIGYWTTDPTVQQRFIHEPMHALAKIFGCEDQMDTYINDNNPNSPVGNFATQWGIFEPYLNMKPTVQQSTIDFVAAFEGFSATPYKDVNTYAIGYGFDFLNGEPVTATTPSMTIEQAKVILGEKLQAIATFVNTTITKVLNQNQFDALIDFGYNLGLGSLRTLLGHGIEQIPTQLARWVDVQGKPYRVLIARRAAEVRLWLTPV